MSSSQKQARDQFCSITGTKDPTALKYLKATSWSLPQALDLYYQSHPSKANKSNYLAKSSSPRGADSKSIETIFESYKDNHEDAILVEGMEKYCQDLQVDPTDISMLILAWHLGAEQMCEFKRKGFCEGWQELDCDTIEKMRNAIPKLKSELNDPALFKKIYQFAFKFGLNSGQRTLGIELACGLWELLLPGKFPLLSQWLTFIQEEHKKAVSKDTWNVLLDFIKTTDGDFKNYDPSGAWPLVYDEFVEYVKRTSS